MSGCGGWLLKDVTEREELHLDPELFPAKWRLFSLKDALEEQRAQKKKKGKGPQE